MSRTTLSVTAAALAAASFGLMAARTAVLGHEAFRPGGGGEWSVMLTAEGRTAGAGARVTTAAPLELPGQHVVRESTLSGEFRADIAAQDDGRRPVRWSAKPGFTSNQFRLEYRCVCAIPDSAPERPATDEPGRLYGPPNVGDDLQPEPGIDSDHPEVADLARNLVTGIDDPTAQAEALFRHVNGAVETEPHPAPVPLSAVECLRAQRGDAAAKSRLLAALCRNRGFPTRLVTGLALTRADADAEQTWVETWLRDHWQPMCATYGYFGHVPATYLVLEVGSGPAVRWTSVTRSHHAFQVERVSDPDGGWVRSAFVNTSLAGTGPEAARVAEFLLLLPVAVLIVSVFRNLIGLGALGTIAPALIGLTFRELHGLAAVIAFVAFLTVAWLLAQALNHVRVQQVPRAVLVSLVGVLALGGLLLARSRHWTVTTSAVLLPLVVLVAVLEQFWAHDENGARATFRTFLATLAIAGCVGLAVSVSAPVRFLLAYPEALGLVIAGQLLLGGYAGYRLLELYRFRDTALSPEAGPAPQVQVHSERNSLDHPRF